MNIINKPHVPSPSAAPTDTEATVARLGIVTGGIIPAEVVTAAPLAGTPAATTEVPIAGVVAVAGTTAATTAVPETKLFLQLSP